MATKSLSASPIMDADELLATAELIDEVCARRAALDPFADIDEAELRCKLFALLDQPSQEAWERACEFEVFPHFFAGLTEPSPLGVTLAQVVYEYGLPDQICPTRDQLLTALRWALHMQLVD